MLAGETFMVTGATGRIGVDLVSRLEELGADVQPLVLAGYPPRPKTLPWPSTTPPILIEDRSDLDRLPTPDYLLNLHWHVDRRLPFVSQILHELEFNINRLSFFWEWVGDRPIRRMTNVSSINVFSHLNQNPLTSHTEPRPSSPYGIAKLAAEKFFDAFFHRSTCSVAHLRLCSVASFGENPSQLMSRLCASVFENQRISINTGHAVYLLHIDEAVDLIINAAITAEGGRYVVTAPAVQVEEVARRFEQISGGSLNAEFVDLAPNIKDPIFASDIEQLRAKWTRRTPLDSMIIKIIGEYRSQAQ